MLTILQNAKQYDRKISKFKIVKAEALKRSKMKISFIGSIFESEKDGDFKNPAI